MISGKQLRFLFVGLLNTLFGYGVYALFIYLGIQYLAANTLSYVLGIIHSYLWNRFFTFRSSNAPGAEFTRFVSIYLISYLFSNIFLWLFIGRLHMNLYIAGALSLLATTIISYVGHNNFSFKKEEPKS